MIVVRSEDGTFLGEVRNLWAMRRKEGYSLVGDFIRVTDEADDYVVLAEYKTKEAAIEQMNCIQNILEWGPGKLKMENLKAYGSPETTQVLVSVYDLRECKIHED
jgi:hypothetical protein